MRMKGVFIGSARTLYNEDSMLLFATEAGSNTSNVALRGLGGDKEGGLESEKVKYVASPKGTRTGE
jgi:hypothetical protein